MCNPEKSGRQKGAETSPYPWHRRSVACRDCHKSPSAFIARVGDWVEGRIDLPDILPDDEGYG